MLSKAFVPLGFAFVGLKAEQEGQTTPAAELQALIELAIATSSAITVFVDCAYVVNTFCKPTKQWPMSGPTWQSMGSACKGRSRQTRAYAS